MPGLSAAQKDRPEDRAHTSDREASSSGSRASSPARRSAAAGSPSCRRSSTATLTPPPGPAGSRAPPPLRRVPRDRAAAPPRAALARAAPASMAAAARCRTHRSRPSRRPAAAAAAAARSLRQGGAGHGGGWRTLGACRRRADDPRGARHSPAVEQGRDEWDRHLVRSDDADHRRLRGTCTRSAAGRVIALVVMFIGIGPLAAVVETLVGAIRSGTSRPSRKRSGRGCRRGECGV